MAKCNYSDKCKRKPTHLVSTKSGDYKMCLPHARVAARDKHTRYVEKLGK